MVSRENSLLSMCSRERFSPGPSSEECVALVPKNKLTHVAINLIGCPGQEEMVLWPLRPPACWQENVWCFWCPRTVGWGPHKLQTAVNGPGASAIECPQVIFCTIPREEVWYLFHQCSLSSKMCAGVQVLGPTPWAVWGCIQDIHGGLVASPLLSGSL